MRPDITLYFVRHGETDWNVARRYQGQTDVPLNDTGRAQAARNGEILRADLGNAAASCHFVSSPLERAVETMQIARTAMGLAPEPFALDDRLKEQNFGHWEGLAWPDLPELDPDGFAARKADTWNWLPRGGENYPMVRARVEPWLDSLTGDTVAVSHGNIGRAVRGILLALSPAVVPTLVAPQDRVLRIRAGQADCRADWL